MLKDLVGVLSEAVEDVRSKPDVGIFLPNRLLPIPLFELESNV